MISVVIYGEKARSVLRVVLNPLEKGTIESESLVKTTRLRFICLLLKSRVGWESSSNFILGYVSQKAKYKWKDR